MLRLNSLIMENFGPFKNEQTIDFPKENGIIIVYGANMRGKTSLLNAIRYAFFGKILSRGSHQISLHQVGNWESALEGKYGFKVTLSFEYDGHRYELTRTCSPRKDVHIPEEDQDYIQECFLRRDGVVFGPDQRDAELSHIMPEQVSRFFLFDGELLQEYEELLRDESEMGRKITEAIERILGVPILTNARIDIREQHQAAQKRESKAAQKNQKTQELGNLLGALMEQRVHHEIESKRLTKDLENLKDTKTSLESILKKTERIRALFDEQNKLEKDIIEIERRCGEKEEKLKEIMSDIWRNMLKDKIQDVRENLQMQISEMQANVTRKAISVEMLKNIKQAISDDQCPTCYQRLDEKAKKDLAKKLIDIQSFKYEKDDSDKLYRLNQLMTALNDFETPDKMDLMHEITDTIEELVVEKATKQDRIIEINDQTKDFNKDESKIRMQYKEYEKTIKEITIVEQGIRAQEGKLKEIDDNIHGLEKKLDLDGGSDLGSESRRRELYSRLFNLFNESVSVYRERLRARVEKDATDLFLKLTNEPDYIGLRINENYGLTIVHRDGKNIPVRSAGAEHIIALSLMGALQKNAPLQGPIIMDSPFGRLDEAHTTKVVRSLPSMADQVMLLVFESELKPQIARNELLGKLRAEYRMVRQSARQTILEKFVEVN